MGCLITVFLSLLSMVTALKMCTSPTLLTNTLNGVQLPDVQMEVLKTEGIMTCVKQCLLRRRCKSVNFDTITGECHLNRQTLDPHLPNNQQLKRANNSVFSDIANWPQKLASACANHDCAMNSWCDPLNNEYVCRPTGCLGSPGLDNGTCTSEPAPEDVSVIGTKLNYTCDRGYGRKGHVICLTNGSWSLGSCVPLTSCAMVRQCRSDHQDGEYWLILPNFNNYKALIYCHNMSSPSPVEYVSLRYTNYGIYPVLFNQHCNHEIKRLVGNCKRHRGGEVWFTKIRVEIETMQVVIRDRTFANLTHDPLDYGVAMDCYTAHKNNVVSSCGTRGRFTIDLRSTGWRVGPDQQWKAKGHRAVVEKVLVSDNGTVVKLHCGGFKGRCIPKGGLFLKPFPPGTVNTTSEELVCL